MAETLAPKDYYFSEKHEWMKLSGDIAEIGITDFAVSALGDIVFIDTEKVGKKINQFETMGTIESVKAAEDLISPISGEIIEVNSDLKTNPGNVNAKPFLTWFVKIKVQDSKEMSNLMKSEDYKKFVLNL